MKYIIHSCNKRMWYVEEFLIPSMTEQGIPKENIEINEDTDYLGCLFNALKCFQRCGKEKINAWHMQDDVIISRGFAEKTQNPDFNGVIMGFWHHYSGHPDIHPGKTSVGDMGYSFPCMYLPHELAGEFVSWFYSFAVHQNEFQRWIEAKKYVDALFMRFMREQHYDDFVYNMKPSLVDHVQEERDKIYKKYDTKLAEMEEKIDGNHADTGAKFQQIYAELEMLTDCMAAVLDGLHQLNCNGAVTNQREALDKFMRKKAHEQD